MFHRRFTVVFVLLLMMMRWPGTLLAASPELPKKLESTVELYLSADAAYKTGDLLTRSQLEELQIYLRRTQGNSLATHPKWRLRMLPDRAPLVRMFHSEGVNTIRQAAAELGGYRELDQLSRKKEGKELLRAATKGKSAVEVVKHVVAQREKAAMQSSTSKTKEDRTATTGSSRIYTAAQFVAALTAEASVAQAPDLTSSADGANDSDDSVRKAG